MAQTQESFISQFPIATPMRDQGVVADDRAHRTLTDAHSLAMDSPLKNNHQLAFGTHTARIDNGVIKEINEAATNSNAKRGARTVRTGKDYLRARTLNRGCPKLLKMVNQWSRERPAAQGQQPMSLTFNYYS